MKKLFYGIWFLIVTLGVCAAVTPTPVFAKTHHKTHHKYRHQASVTVYKLSNERSDVRTAQEHLAHLGYYTAKVDGLMGPKTKSALKQFQLDQGLCDTGSLTNETRKALHLSDHAHLAPSVEVLPLPNQFFATHPDFYGHVDPEYADPLIITGAGGKTVASQTLPSRFGHVEVTQDATAALKKYNVTVNDQPILQVANQPSVIGISSTYQLPNEDVIIFTTFDASNQTCVYKHHLLTLHNGGSQLHLVDDCTETFQANIANTSLVITFPESDDGRAVGAMWRYENGALEKL
jgi:Putative peptidoglycan binding domain